MFFIPMTTLSGFIPFQARPSKLGVWPLRILGPAPCLSLMDLFLILDWGSLTRLAEALLVGPLSLSQNPNKGSISYHC